MNNKEMLSYSDNPNKINRLFTREELEALPR